jgi:hypothetical protein
VYGFITADDRHKLENGQVSRGDRYILVMQAAQFAGRAMPPALFATIAKQARTVDFLAGARDSVNADLSNRYANAPAALRTMQMGDAGTGTVVIDTPTCIARSGHTVVANQNGQVTERMIVAFVYSDSQVYTTAGYAHDTPADTQWLATDFLNWLRGICGAS